MHLIRLRVIAITLIVCQGTLVIAQTEPMSSAAEKPARVLFIGNSYTYYNDLPSLVSAFAAMTDRPLQTKGRTKAAAQLSLLWSFDATQYLLKDEKWDYVVLQEQSTLPLTAPSRMRDSIRTIDAAVKEAGAKTVLFVTWARDNLPDTQAPISAAYSTVGTEIGALMAPVGLAWRMAVLLDPKIPLYDADGTHPSPTGSYLAACTLFMVIAARHPCPPLEVQGVTSENAEKARAAALKALTTQRPPN